MTDVVRCDECGAVGTLYEFSWRKVEYVAEILRAFTDPRDKHLCSLDCLRSWAEEESEGERT